MDRSENTMDNLVELDALNKKMECQYVRGADGAFFMEVQNPNGQVDYLPAEKGLSFQEMPSGKYQAVRDPEEHERQRDLSSHRDFFEDKQRVRRSELLARQVQRLCMERAAPSYTAPNFKVIKDEQLQGLHKEFQEAFRAGEPERSEFHPLSYYSHKLYTKSGKQLRPIFAGEVGMMHKSGVIVVLERGFGTGGFSQVPLIGGK